MTGRPVEDVVAYCQPAVVSDDNWSWRMPWPAERLQREPGAGRRAAVVRKLAEESHRWSR